MKLTIGETIRILRSERAITQERLAEQLNVSAPAVSKWERGAFDLSEKGLEKTRRLAEKAKVTVNTFSANLWHFRLTENYDILYSSGVFEYIKPEIRAEIMENYKAHVNEGGLVAFHTFVEKPFIRRAPDRTRDSYAWKSGELFTYFHDWYIEYCCEYVFDCNSSGIPHKHAANRLFARNIKKAAFDAVV